MDEKFSLEQKRKRACRRVAQVLYEHWDEGTGAHSRVFETLIPYDYIYIANSVNGVGWREHIIPCCLIRDRCFQLFKQGKSVEDVATFIEEHLKLVEITRQEQQRLDVELGLKNSMPSGWDWEQGDIMSRLKQAGIFLSTDFGK